MVYSVEIINKNSKKFRFQEGECRTTSYDLSSKIFKQSMPGGSAEDAIVINMGREITIDVPFSLRETDGDATDGTHTSTVKTVQEKVDYLLGTFVTDGLEDKYTVNIYSSAANILSKVGLLDKLRFDFSAEKPNVLSGTITISVGGGQQS